MRYKVYAGSTSDFNDMVKLFESDDRAEVDAWVAENVFDNIKPEHVYVDIYDIEENTIKSIIREDGLAENRWFM